MNLATLPDLTKRRPMNPFTSISVLCTLVIALGSLAASAAAVGTTVRRRSDGHEQQRKPDTTSVCTDGKE